MRLENDACLRTFRKFSFKSKTKKRMYKKRCVYLQAKANTNQIMYMTYIKQMFASKLAFNHIAKSLLSGYLTLKNWHEKKIYRNFFSSSITTINATLNVNRQLWITKKKTTVVQLTIRSQRNGMSTILR